MGVHDRTTRDKDNHNNTPSDLSASTAIGFSGHFSQQRMLRGQKFLYFWMFQVILKISIFGSPHPTHPPCQPLRSLELKELFKGNIFGNRTHPQIMQNVDQNGPGNTRNISCLSPFPVQNTVPTLWWQAFLLSSSPKPRYSGCHPAQLKPISFHQLEISTQLAWHKSIHTKENHKELGEQKHTTQDATLSKYFSPGSEVCRQQYP